MTRRIVAGSVGLALAAVLAPAAHAQKTLVYCSGGQPRRLQSGAVHRRHHLRCQLAPDLQPLVEFEHGTTNIQPGLAESWTVSDDGLEYTFNLRQDVAFHTTDWFTPSRPFNADDVLFSFERQWKADHPYHGVSGGTYEYFNSMGLQELLKSIEKVDEHTVKFVLNEPEAPFIANMGMDFGSILSAEYADQMMQAGTPEQVDLQPVGTGPFQFVAYQKDAVIRYQAHPDYWEGKAPLDNLIFAITPDASVRWQKLQAGECHVMPYPNPADLDAMRNHPDIEVLEQEGLNVGYLAFNNEKPPFDNVRVRQALNMAVNKDAIIDAVFQGAGTVAKNPIPPTIWSYNDAVEDYPVRPGPGQEDPRGGGRHRPLRPTSGRCRCSGPTIPMPGAWPS